MKAALRGENAGSAERVRRVAETDLQLSVNYANKSTGGRPTGGEIPPGTTAGPVVQAQWAGPVFLLIPPPIPPCRFLIKLLSGVLDS